MLTAVNGYIDGNQVIVDESINAWQGRNVIVTILDSVWSGNSSESEDSYGYADEKKAAMELAGLWKNHEDISVEDSVRNMRRGRNFDN